MRQNDEEKESSTGWVRCTQLREARMHSANRGAHSGSRERRSPHPWYVNKFRWIHAMWRRILAQSSAQRFGYPVTFRAMKKPQAMRCPYCADAQNFKLMIKHVDGRFICSRCGHVIRPGDSDFSCNCGSCTDVFRLSRWSPRRISPSLHTEVLSLRMHPRKKESTT